MREPPAVRLVVDFRDQAGPGRLVKQVDCRGVSPCGRRRHQGGVEPLADQRCDLEYLGALVGQPSQPPPHHVAHGLRDLRGRLTEPGPFLVERAKVGQVPGHLQEEEGVSGGVPLKFPRHQRLAFPEGPADRGLEQRGDGIGLKPAQREAPAVDVARQGVQHRRQVAPLRLDVAVHRHREQRGGAPGLHQVGQQQEGGQVRPLQVIEDQQHGMAGPHRRDPRVKRLEEPEALRLGRGQGLGRGSPDPLRGLRAHPGDFPGQVAQVLAQQCLRAGLRVISQRLTEGLVRGEDVLVPPPVKHEALAGVREPRQLAGERRLPDSRLPADECQDAVARRRARPRLAQEAELPLAAHEVAADRGVEPPQVRGTRVVAAAARPRRRNARPLASGAARAARSAVGPGRALGRGRLPAGRQQELLPVAPGQAHGVGQQLGGVPAGGPVDTALQVTDRPRADVRGRGQLLLGHPGPDPQPLEQLREPTHRLLRHGRHPFADPPCFRIH